MRRIRRLSRGIGSCDRVPVVCKSEEWMYRQFTGVHYVSLCGVPAEMVSTCVIDSSVSLSVIPCPQAVAGHSCSDTYTPSPLKDRAVFLH